MCGTLEFSKIAHRNSEKWVWDDAGSGCNVAVPNLPRREVGRADVYWLALGTSARTSGGRLGTATLLPLLVVKGVLSHTLTFECVGQWSWKVLNYRRDAVLVQNKGGNRQRHYHYVCVW